MNCRRLVLGGLCAMSIVVGSADVAVATMVRPGGASYTGRVVEQIDSQTFRIDIGGPAKEGALRGVVIARADRATRFNLTGGVRSGLTLYGSLGIAHGRSSRFDSTKQPSPNRLSPPRAHSK